jgi:hypothetical protein
LYGIISKTVARIRKILNFLRNSGKLRLALPLVLCVIALVDFVLTNRVRRTCVFYNSAEGKTVVEERMLPRSKTEELGIKSYVEDVILGPKSVEEMALFNEGSSVEAIMLRAGLVYINLSSEAAVPPVEGGEVLNNLQVLKEGIFRNFPNLKEVYIFIGGNEIL